MARGCRIQQPLVVRSLGEIRIGPIGQQREADVAVGIGQIVSFELLGLLGNDGLRRQQYRHRHEGAHRSRHALRELQSWQMARSDQCSDESVYQHDGDVVGRKQPEQRKQHGAGQHRSRLDADQQQWTARMARAISAIMPKYAVGACAICVRRIFCRRLGRKPISRSNSPRPVEIR